MKIIILKNSNSHDVIERLRSTNKDIWSSEHFTISYSVHRIGTSDLHLPIELFEPLKSSNGLLQLSAFETDVFPDYFKVVDMMLYPLFNSELNDWQYVELHSVKGFYEGNYGEYLVSDSSIVNTIDDRYDASIHEINEDGSIKNSSTLIFEIGNLLLIFSTLKNTHQSYQNYVVYLAKLAEDYANNILFEESIQSYETFKINQKQQ